MGAEISIHNTKFQAEEHWVILSQSLISYDMNPQPLSFKEDTLPLSHRGGLAGFTNMNPSLVFLFYSFFTRSITHNTCSEASVGQSTYTTYNVLWDTTFYGLLIWTSGPWLLRGQGKDKTVCIWTVFGPHTSSWFTLVK